MPDDLISLIRLALAGIWQRRWSVLVVAWLIALVGWTAVATLPDRYTATAQVYVDTDSILGPLMNNLAVAPDVQGQVRMMRQTLLSRPNLETIASKTGLVPKGTAPRELDRIYARLQDEIDVRPIDASLLEVRYTAAAPRTAYAVVAAVLDLFVAENLGHTRRDVDAARSFIDGQIADYEAKLREADLALARFKREHADELVGADRAQRELDDARTAKRSLESELASAAWQRDQLRLQRASTPSRLPRADVERGPTAAESELMKLQTDLNRLRLVFTDRHPDVISLTRLVEQARSEVEQERRQRNGVNTVPNPLVAQYDEQMRGLELRTADLQRRIRLAAEEVERLARKAADTPAVEADLLRLTRDYDALSRNYQELVQRRETANLAKQMDVQTRSIEFRVVEPPVVPNSPSGPWRGALIAGVAVVGLGAGIGLALLRLVLTREVLRPEQLIAAFEIPIAGVVRELRSPRARTGRRLEAAVACLVAVALVGGTGGLLHRNRVEPIKVDLSDVFDQLGAWTGVRELPEWLG
jgi:polysaccharide chain length determinant protein (PEP-CTERM system associated)